MTSGSGTLCASWQCLEVPRGPPPSLAVQFVGSGTSLSGMDVELVGSRYRMSLVKKRFATGTAGPGSLTCLKGALVFPPPSLMNLMDLISLIYRHLQSCFFREVHGRLLPVNQREGFREFCTFRGGGRPERDDSWRDVSARRTTCAYFCWCPAVQGPKPSSFPHSRCPPSSSYVAGQTFPHSPHPRKST